VKITIVLPRPADHPTGGYIVQYQYANSLVALGHRVTVVHPWSNAPFRDRERWLGYVTERARLAAKRSQLVPWFELDDRVRVRVPPYLTANLLPRADVTLFTAWQTVDAVRRLARRHGRPFQFVYDYEFWRSCDERTRQRMTRAFMRADVRRIASSRAVAGMLEEAGSDYAGRVTCGLDHERWRQLRSPEDRELVVGFPIRDEPHKGTADAAAAAQLVRERLPDVKVIAFGQSAVELPPGVCSQGQISDRELRDFYNACAVFLLPSRYEGWGLPAAEAMACGAAVVTTANGGTEDFALDGQTALVVAPADPVAMADAICDLLQNADRRVRVASAARERVAQMTWESSTRGLLEIIT
jgi:glycosyltransferase involved in cell wall biosynthesis